MKLQSNLNEIQRIIFLKENREEIITLITSLEGNLKDVMDTLLQCVNNSNFYDFCDMETREFNVTKRIKEIIEETSGTPNILDTETQNFFEDQRKKQIELLN